MALRDKDRNRKNLESVKRLVVLLEKGMVRNSTKAVTVGTRKGRIWEEFETSAALVYESLGC